MRRRTAIVASVLALMVATLGVTSGTAFAAKSKAAAQAQRAKKAKKPAARPAPKPAAKPTSTTAKPRRGPEGSGKPADEQRPKDAPSGDRTRPPKSSDEAPQSADQRPKPPANAFRCATGHRDGARVAFCQWSATENAAFGAYRLWRAEPGTERKVIFTTRDRATTSYADRTVIEGKSYGYALELLDKEGRSIGHSEMVKVTCCAASGEPGRDQPTAVRLECRAGTPEGQPTVGCRWTGSDSPSFGGYRLWRATGDTNKQVVFATRDRGETHFIDRDVQNGTGYAYAVEVLDQDGKPIGRSEIVRVRCCEPPPTTTTSTTGS